MFWLAVIVRIVLVPAVYGIAESKERDAVQWAIAAAILPIPAFVAVLVAPDLSAVGTSGRTGSISQVCPDCHVPLGAEPAEVRPGQEVCPTCLFPVGVGVASPDPGPAA